MILRYWKYDWIYFWFLLALLMKRNALENSIIKLNFDQNLRIKRNLWLRKTCGMIELWWTWAWPVNFSGNVSNRMNPARIVAIVQKLSEIEWALYCVAKLRAFFPSKSQYKTTYDYNYWRQTSLLIIIVLNKYGYQEFDFLPTYIRLFFKRICFWFYGHLHLHGNCSLESFRGG